MAVTLRVTPVVGLPQFNGWSHVLEHLLDPQTKYVVCFSVSGDSAGNIGRDVVESIQNLPPRSAQGLFQMVEDCVQLVTEQGGELTMAAGVFRHQRSVFAAYNSSIVLKRGSKVGPILSAKNEPQIIEGQYQLDDVFVFSTEQARQFNSQIQLNFERGFDSDGVITSVVPALHSVEDSSLSALAFIAVTDQESEVEAEPPPTFELDIQEASEEDQEQLITVEQARATVEQTELSKNQVPLEDQLTDAVAQAATPNEPVVTATDGSISQQQSSQESAARTTAKASTFVASLGSIASKIGKAFAWLVRFVKTLLLKVSKVRRVFSKRTYLDSPPSKKTIRIVVGIVVLIVVLIGIAWLFYARMQQQQAAAEAAAQPYRKELSSTVALANQDPLAAREEVSILIEEIKNAQTEADANGEPRTVEELGLVLSEAQSAYQDISGKDEVSELPIFYDLRLVSSDFIATLATSVGDKAVFVDTEKQEVIALETATKQVTRLGIGDIGSVRSIAALGNNQLLLLANGIYSLTLEDGQTPEELKEEGDSNRAGSLTSSFGSFVYVFNPEERNIYRYVENEEGYSDPIGWLQDPLGVPFDSVSSWSIDGEIWMGTDGGQILRFASGREEEYSIVGLEKQFSSLLYLVTREDLDTIYVLEPGASRLVSLTKAGEFLREVTSSSLGAATAVLLNQAADTAYIVSGSSVFEVEL